MTLRRLLLVLLGGSVGTAARLAVGLWMPEPDGIPIATLVVNIVGALLIGILAARIPQTTDVRVLLGTGVLGGFTTYSAFTTGTIALWADAPLAAFSYAIISLALGLVAAALGLRIGRPRDRAGREAAE
ncbi:CrcB family protein [Microbacterium sp. 3J1]|uniref:fluoride efflux transporter FluC n=1 Tax=Microbacterium sp. 3J1 TaxID=861269 RepID=UPI000A784E00|nr:CrcB family protein [Microbacterium sp. 3J1]